MEQEQLQQPLPYAPIEAGLSRNDQRQILKDIGGKLGRQSMFVPITQIAIRENFNWRLKPEGMTEDEWLYSPDELDIKSLADGIYQSCGNPALDVDMTSEGVFYVTDGFRRYHARMRLLRDGKMNFPDGTPVDMIEVQINSKETTEEDRMLAVFRTQDNKKLKPMEIALGLKRVKDAFGYSNEKIAELIGKSRQYVDNKIALAEEPVEIREAIDKGQLSPTAATELSRSGLTETERVHKVQESIDNNIPLKVEDAMQSKQAKREAAENRQQSLFDDGAMSIDTTKEKEEAEFACNSAIGTADKIVKYLGGMNKQNREDVERLLDFIVKDVTLAREYIKKSPNRR